MQQQYDNTNTGLLARNDRKETENHPDYKGTVNVDGVEYWLSGWIKVGKEGGKLAGQKYFSLSLQPKDAMQPKPRPRQAAAAPAPQRRAAPAPASFEGMEDDIPF